MPELDPTVQNTVDLAALLPADQQEAGFGDFRGSSVIDVPEGWSVEGASREYAGSFCAVVTVDYRTATGDPDQKTVILRIPSAAVVATRTNQDGAREMLVVDQTRHGAGKTLYELPAGMPKKGAGMRETAVGWLANEGGIEVDPEELHDEGVLHRDPARSPNLDVFGFSTEVHVFDLALDAEAPATAATEADPGKHISKVRWVPLTELYGMVDRGELADMSLVAAVGRTAVRELIQGSAQLPPQ